MDWRPELSGCGFAVAVIPELKRGPTHELCQPANNPRRFLWVEINSFVYCQLLQRLSICGANGLDGNHRRRKSLDSDARTLPFDTSHSSDGCQWIHFVKVSSGPTDCSEEKTNALHRGQRDVDPCSLCDLSKSMGGSGNIRHDVLSGSGIGVLGRGHQSGIDGAEHSRWLEDVWAASKVLNRFAVRAVKKWSLAVAKKLRRKERPREATVPRIAPASGRGRAASSP